MARPKPWLIHFFQRHPADDPDREVPPITFLVLGIDPKP